MSAEFTYHIQIIDFSVEELGAVTEAEAIRAFERRDWSKELKGNSSAIAEGKACPPAFGYHDLRSSSELLVGVFDADSVVFCISAQEPARFLGVIPYTRRISHEVSGYPLHKVSDLLSMFFRRDFASIKAIRS